MVETSVLSAARAAFSASYGEARERFCAVAPPVRAYPSPAAGPRRGARLPPMSRGSGPRKPPT
jgi:hypothetical protein